MVMASGLSTTSYALLGLLVFDSATSTNGLTGYEIKQRADSTLRFYWTAPAMSQIYTEMGRLHADGLAEPVKIRSGRRNTRRYVITDRGRSALHDWLINGEIEFPVLKHPIALRLLMGHLLEPVQLQGMLDGYRLQLEKRRAELQSVREMLGTNAELKFPAMVADWGLHYYDSESEIIKKLSRRLRT